MGILKRADSETVRLISCGILEYKMFFRGNYFRDRLLA
jgi:hypothetical protein